MRPPFIEKQNARHSPWSDEEDVEILSHHEHEAAGEVHRQLRWNVNNYPQQDRDNNHDKSFGVHEDELIIKLHATIGSRSVWFDSRESLLGYGCVVPISDYFCAKVDHYRAATAWEAESEVKDCWNTKLKRRLTEMGIELVTHKSFSQVLRDYGNIGGNVRVVGNRVGSIHHSKDLRNAYLSNSNSKSQHQRRRQQQFTPIQRQAHPSKAPAKMPNSLPTSPLSLPPKSAAESLSWADFLIGDDSFSGDHILNETTGGLPFSLPDDPYGMIMPSGNAGQCPSSWSSLSSSAADDSFVETLLNKHTEMFMDFPEIWDELIRRTSPLSKFSICRFYFTKIDY